MTNLQHFKKSITAANLCEKINCDQCPFFEGKVTDWRLMNCKERLVEWAEKEKER